MCRDAWVGPWLQVNVCVGSGGFSVHAIAAGAGPGIRVDAAGVNGG